MVGITCPLDNFAGTPAVPVFRRWLASAAFFVAALAGIPVVASGHPVMMWELQGETNRIFILGSVHLLRESDYPIPSVIYRAYDEAETLIMELDHDDIDPVQTQKLIAELGMISDGRSLQDLMGSAKYAKAAKLAQEIEVPLEMLTQTEPWLAAISVEVMLMTRLGFDASQGVETHLSEKAQSDGKEILGFETERQQFGILDNLSRRAQQDLLLQTLADGAELEDILDGMIDAWRHGDVEHLETALLSDMMDYDELYNAIVVKRNRDWVRQIGALTNDRDDYLIVVGALHMAGEDGVPELLRRRGHEVQQMRQ